MITFHIRLNLFLLFSMLGILTIFFARHIHADSPSTPSWRQQHGNWVIEFSEHGSVLKCFHEGTGTEVSGLLEFAREDEDGKKEVCKVIPPRDSVGERLGVMDPEGNVQGYIVFTGASETLEITPIHRTAQNYEGVLTFDAMAHLGGAAFPCRTQPTKGTRVVQMSSGHADSRLNDSLFNPETDTALRFRGNTVSITSCSPEDVDKRFHAILTGAVSEPSSASISLELITGYYRTRYVPYYHPIDRKRCPRAPTGWMSWNVYFDTAGEKENLDEARAAAHYLKPYGMEIFSIESWQDNSPELPVSKFHNLTLRPDPNKFPSGMKWLADRIRELGFKPGIWTVPFGTGDRSFYIEHKDWFLHDEQGQPMQNWCGLYLLDPSQEAVRRHMEETHAIMSSDWGYEYFKIDGMSGRNAGYSAHFYERPEVRNAFREPCDDPFRLCVEALRRGIGPDRIWLACQGHYTGPEIGFADAGRIGADIVAHRRPPDWNNYSNQARTTLNQLFVNNIVWYNDPDTLLVGTANPLETVRLAATVVALTGQAMFAGDKLTDLPPERMRLLQQCLPVCDIHPMDMFPIFDLLPVWVLKIRRPFGEWDVVSLFNWSETEETVSITFEELGLDPAHSYLAYDCWNGVLFHNLSDRLSATVPPHGNALFTLHAEREHPQIVYSDRHIAQCATGLEALNWDASTHTLSGVNYLVENAPTLLVAAVPENYTFAAVETDEGISHEVSSGPDGTITLRLQRPSGEHTPLPAAWKLRF